MDTRNGIAERAPVGVGNEVESYGAASNSAAASN